MKKKRPRCHNCKFAGDPFKINTKTHMHCEHPKWKKEDMQSGKISPWDTLCEFWETCKDHEFKEPVDNWRCGEGDNRCSCNRPEQCGYIEIQRQLHLIQQ